MPTLPAADHTLASAEWVITRVWLSYPDTAAWLTARFMPRTEMYEWYAAAVDSTNADLRRARDLRRAAATSGDLSKYRRLARLLDAELPDVPLIKTGPTAGLLAKAGPRIFYSVAGQYLGTLKRNGTHGYMGVYRRGRLDVDPGLLPPDADEPFAWPSSPNTDH